MFNYFIITFTIIFFIACFGIIIKRENCLLALFAIELMYLGISALLILYSVMHETTLGQIYALYIILLAACESAVGLGIMIVLYRWGQSLNLMRFNLLTGCFIYWINPIIIFRTFISFLNSRNFDKHIRF